jgi:pSer/pThr/pTyr-binding forkhead associated (FHA) protein
MARVRSKTRTATSPAAGITERFDPLTCIDQRVRAGATPAQELAAGRYVQVEGTTGSLVIPLGSEPIHIGRGLSADLRLDEVSVSRRHAILLSTDDGTRVLDDRSSNGTFVNGKRVQQAELHNGDVIAVGRFLLRYLVV